MAFSLTRNAKLYVSTVKTGFSNANTWRVEVLDGFSFPANVSNQEITVSEAGTDPIRGQQAFITSIDPVDWSFSAYVRPYTSTNVLAPELILWDAMSSADGSGLTEGLPATGTVIDFEGSNKNQLQLLQLYFDLGGGQWYHVEDAVVNTAEFDFGIDQIAMIAWSGQGKIVNKSDATTSPTNSDLTAMVTGDNYVDIPDPAPEFLQNKLTTVEMAHRNDIITFGTDGTTASDTSFSSAADTFQSDGVTAGDFLVIKETGGDSYEVFKIASVTNETTLVLERSTSTTVAGTVDYDIVKGYDIALTGGNLTITNNITYLTPESLGVVNRPIQHFAGTRGVSGSMSVYLKTGATDQGTADLFSGLSGDTSTVTQDFNLFFSIGGARTVPTRIEFELRHAHLNVPVIDIQDVVSLNVDYVGLPYNETTGAFDLEAKNEVIVTYHSPA